MSRKWCRIEADVRMRQNDPESAEAQILAKVEFLGDAYAMAQAIADRYPEVRVVDDKDRTQFTFRKESQ